MMIAIHLSLPFCKFLFIGEAAGFCIEQLSFTCVYCIMAFWVSFPPMGSTASHTLHVRQLVNPFSQVEKLWPSSCGDNPQAQHKTLECCFPYLSVKPILFYQAGTPNATVAPLELQGGHRTWGPAPRWACIGPESWPNACGKTWASWSGRPSLNPASVIYQLCGLWQSGMISGTQFSHQ